MVCAGSALTFKEPAQSLAGIEPEDGGVDLQGAMAEAQSLIARREYALALVFTEACVGKVEASDLYAPALGDDPGNEYRAFRNIFEEALYRRLYKPERQVLPVPEELFGLYAVHGWLLFELGRFDEAGKALEKAVRLNPVNGEALLELAEVRKAHGDWDGLLALTKRAHGVAYTRWDLGRCYRNLGFFHIERKNYDLAIALFHYSLVFDPESRMARSELLHIHEETGQSVKAPGLEAITAALKAGGVPLGGSEAVIKTVLALGREAALEGRPDEAMLFNAILYEVTLDEGIGQCIEGMAS